MKLKPIVVITVLSLVVASLLVSGCTSSTTNSSTTNTGNNSSQNQTNLLQDLANQFAFPTNKSDLSKDITASYVSNGHVVVKAFTKTTNQYGNVVYTGVVKDDNATQLDPIYQHNVTIELTKNKTDTTQRLATIYKSRGIPENTTKLPSSTRKRIREIG